MEKLEAKLTEDKTEVQIFKDGAMVDEMSAETYFTIQRRLKRQQKASK